MGKNFKFKLQVNFQRKAIGIEMPKGNQVRCRDGINNPILASFSNITATVAINQYCALFIQQLDLPFPQSKWVEL